MTLSPSIRTYSSLVWSTRSWLANAPSLFMNLYQLALSVMIAVSRCTLALIMGDQLRNRCALDMEAAGRSATLNQRENGTAIAAHATAGTLRSAVNFALRCFVNLNRLA